MLARLSRFYSASPESILNAPRWALVGMIANMPKLNAEEELSNARLIHTFTRQPQGKADGQNVASKIKKFVRGKKRIISEFRERKNRISTSAERVDFDLLSVDEKRELAEWAAGAGVAKKGE